MVRLHLPSVRAVLTHRCRALNTIHEALTVAGGLFLNMHSSRRYG